MPREIVLSNHRMYIGMDNNGNIRDLFYPFVGMYNHLSGNKIRTGICLDIQDEKKYFSWLDSDVWVKEFSIHTESQNYIICYKHSWLDVKLVQSSTISKKDDIYTAEYTFYNGTNHAIDVSVFFTHDLNIDESDIGDTSFYHPAIKGIIHYKGNRVFLFKAKGNGGLLDQYACGIKGFAGMQGTWMDAEDGMLEMNPIAQGSVDSTFRYHFHCYAKESLKFYYNIVASDTIQNIEKINKNLLSKDIKQFDSIHKKNTDTARIDADKLYQISKDMVLAHVSENGAIIAACDSDIMETNRANYCYYWPRDGAHIASLLLQIGEKEWVEKYLNFSIGIYEKYTPYFLQKYRPDGTLGASWHPWIYQGKLDKSFQQDETALSVITAVQYLKTYPKSKEKSRIVNNFLIPALNFFCEHIHKSTSLPLPSWDLWEERRGIHFHTTCAALGAFRDVLGIAEAICLDKKLISQYSKVYAEMKLAFRKHFWDTEGNRWFRCLFLDEHDNLHPDYTADSATLTASLMDLDVEDKERCNDNYNFLKDKLQIHSDIGGFARYEGDYYFRRSEDYPGNPWIISTVWFGLVADKLGLHSEAEKCLDWCVYRASDTGMLAEQYHPETGEMLSVSPLTWSHAEYMFLYQKLRDK